MPAVTHWKTKAGEEILISDLADSHLENILKMFLRQAPLVRLRILGDAYGFAGMCRGDAAQDAMEAEIYNIECQDDEDLLAQHDPRFKALYREFKRRNPDYEPGYSDPPF